MATTEFLFLDGKAHRSDKLLISPNNRSFRYGDGFFETMKCEGGKLLLADYHFERLFKSLDQLRFQPPAYFNRGYLEQQINELIKKNGHSKLARIRITVFRGEGALYDMISHYPHHLIQSWDLNPSNNSLNENGLVIDLFKDARKVSDGFSHIKSNNYLNYAMAALWAKEQHLNDAILCNSFDRVADATIANVFIIKDGVIKTPAISEGPVAGVMRRHLINCMKAENMPIEEGEIELEELFQASEIFLTNAIYGIRWVRKLNNHQFSNQMAVFMYKSFF